MAAEVKQRNNRIIMVVLGLVLAAAAFGLSLYVSKSGNNSGSGSGGQQVQVVVAKTDLPQGTQLTADVLTTKSYSVDQAPASAVTDETTVLGKYLSLAVTMNTPISTNLLVPDATSAKTATLSLAPLDIHSGNVAMAIPVAGAGSSSAELNAFGLYVQADDHFDIIIDDGKGTVRYAFQDIRVLKVGSYSAAGTGSANVLVIEVPRAEAEAIAFLMDHNGQPGRPSIVRYVLRPRASASPTAPPNYVDVPGFAPNKADNGVSDQSFSQLFPTH